MLKPSKKKTVPATHRRGRVALTATRAHSGAQQRRSKRAEVDGLWRQANARVELMLDSITGRFFGLDRQWRFTYFNKHAQEMLKSLGRNPAALIGKVYWDEFPVRYAENAVRRAMSERVEVVHEFYFAPLKQWVEGRIYPTPDGGLAIYQRDITGRKRAEEELRRSEACLAEGERIAHMGSWAVKIPSWEIFWSQEMFRIYQLDPKKTKLSQSMAFQLIHLQDRQLVTEAFERAVREKSNYEVRHRAILPDGTLKYLHSLGRPVLNESGELVEYLGMVVDVTKQTEDEASLREANERVEMILDSITDRFFALDKEWRYIHFNKHAADQLKILGKDPARLIGKVVWEEFPNSPVEEVCRRAVREQSVITHEHYFPPLEEWIENRIYPIAGGGVVIFQKYVTERKRVEAALRRSEANLAEGQRISHTGSWAWNASSGAIFSSQELLRIFGLEAMTTPPTHETFLQVIHPEDQERIRQAFDGATQSRADYEAEYRVVRADGALRYIHNMAHPVFNESGALIEYVGTAVDITERHEAEALLRAANEKVKTVLDSITDQFFAFSKDWRFTYLNTRAAEQMRLLGKDPAKLIGKVLWDEFPNPPNEAAIRRVMTERVVVTDALYYPPLGEWVQNAIYPSQDGGLVTFQRYITEQKRAEEALQQTQAKLAHVLRVTTMGEMAASIAHEINQPLGAIVNNGNVCLQLVGVPDSEEKAREVLLDIVHDANRASAIIARIRALTKRSTSEKTSLSVKELVDDVLALANHAATNADVKITTSVPDSLRLAGDRIQLQQMLLNLVMNAIEAMRDVKEEKRMMTIQANGGELENKPAVVVSVQDNGDGFSSGDALRLFEPFFTTKPNGTGMGLGISRTIAEAHGGRLWAIQNNGPGATFCCALPLELETAL
jgi:PAS domain S-box-containing protein